MQNFDFALWILTVIGLIVAARVVENWLRGHWAIGNSCEEQIAALKREYEEKISELEEELRIVRDRFEFFMSKFQESSVRISELERNQEKADDVQQGGRTLVVAASSGVGGWMDLAALRSLPVSITRLQGVTKSKLSKYLNRARFNNRAALYLHLAAHADESGVQLDDGIVDAEWLSENLAGVKVLLLAGCRGDEVGDWLGVVPYVVTMREDVHAEDAAMFGRVFWADVLSGVGVDAALQNALRRAPAGMAEYVEHHW